MGDCRNAAAFSSLQSTKSKHTFMELIDLVTVVPTKSDSDVIFCLQLLSETLTCTLHLS